MVLQEVTTYNWKETGIVYWRGKKVNRDSKDYDDIIDELYISTIQNEFYRNAIKNCKLPIVHMLEKILKMKQSLQDMSLNIC